MRSIQSFFSNLSYMLSSPLHCALRKAIEQDYNGILRILCYLPIDFNRSYNGDTSLQYAIRYGYFDLLRYSAETGIQALQINSQNINARIQQGHYAGLSIAFILAKSTEGCARLASNELVRLITPQTLNTIATEGPNAGESLAFILANSPDGLTILAANECELARQITKQTLNAIVTNRFYYGLSVAYSLSKTAEGRAILAANHHELGQKISIQTLNSKQHYSMLSLKDLLTRTREGLAILATNNNHRADRCIYFIFNRNKEECKRIPMQRLPAELIREVAKNLKTKSVKLGII